MFPVVPRNPTAQKHFERLPSRRRILILGSTGSIGCSALDVISRYPEHFELAGLVAFGNKPQDFVAQYERFRPKRAALMSEKARVVMQQLGCGDIQCGTQAVNDLIASPDVDIVLAAIVGSAGLRPVLHALKHEKIVALANKESLVVGGGLVRDLSSLVGPKIIPVDSEHSGLFQAFLGSADADIEKLTITASGGPFLRFKTDDLLTVTSEQATNHPRWKMGPKISVDSATLMNKGLELIEAHYLFGIEAKHLSAVVHPQSIVHAIVEMKDGACLMQAANPDMRQPIAFALNYPRIRMQNVITPLDLTRARNLEFEKVDHVRFPAVALALQAIETGPTACTVLNDANEFAVSRFLEQQLRFVDIVPFVEELLAAVSAPGIESVEAVEALQIEIRQKCDLVFQKFKIG